MVLLLFMNLYHRTPSYIMLISVVFNKQVNTTLLPSHTVTSSGSVISVVEINYKSIKILKRIQYMSVHVCV